MNGSETSELTPPQGKGSHALASSKASTAKASTTKASKTKASALKTRRPTKPLASHPSPAVWTAPSSQVLEQIKDFRQQLEAIQTQITAMNQQSEALDSNLGELRQLSQQMQALSRSHAVQQSQVTKSPVPHPRLDDWSPVDCPSVPSSVPFSAAPPPASHASSTSAETSEASTSPDSLPLAKPSFVSRSQPIAPYSASAHASKAVKPSLIVTAATVMPTAASPAQSVLPRSAQPVPPRSIVAPAAPPNPKSASAPPIHPPAVRVRRPAHSKPPATSTPLRLRLQGLLPIPNHPVTIAIDALLWTLVATGVRLGIQGVILWIPSLAVPLTLVMLLPAIVAAYLAFFVPQSSTTVIYRLLLITLGLFLGSKV
ncbi:MAG: hypothetical protein B0A82_00420 [Alkalinema sp. CACIAM 70d]|nr:MAG: hypothetical protein B0A82_00420 [Alkalinema sp. CACIAM 70d]